MVIEVPAKVIKPPGILVGNGQPLYPELRTDYGVHDKCPECPNVEAHFYPYWCNYFSKFVWDAVRGCSR